MSNPTPELGAADLDGDGKAELLLRSDAGLIAVRLDGTGRVLVARLPAGATLGPGWTYDPLTDDLAALADLDGDGRAELVILGPRGLAVLALDPDPEPGQPAGFAVQTRVLADERIGDWVLDPPRTRVSAPADYDGDAKLELVLTGPAGLALVGLRDGALHALVVIPDGARVDGWPLDAAETHAARAGDTDANRKAELLVHNDWGLGLLEFDAGSRSLRALRLVANGARLDHRHKHLVEGDWRLDTRTDLLHPMADYDGDGKAELLVTGPAGLAFLRLTGDGLKLHTALAWGQRFANWELDPADRIGPVGRFDHDDHVEITLIGAHGLAILNLDASGLISVPAVCSTTTHFGADTLGRRGPGPWRLDPNTERFLFAADLDGDGRDELVALGPQGLAVLGLSWRGLRLEAVWTPPS